MADSPTSGELAERCERRANDMLTDAQLLELELAALEAQKDTRWTAFQADKSNDTRRQWVVFHDRMSAVKSSLRTTLEDEAHYRDCARALRDFAEQPA